MIYWIDLIKVMLYQLDLRLLINNVQLSAQDRNGNELKLHTVTENGLTKISTQISMPNKITLNLSKTADSGQAELKSVVLGHIQFNSNSLERLLIYHHEHGLNRSTIWTFDGKVEFDFFDYNPISQHLNLGTQI
jgi:hypothetical protein